MRLPAAWCAKTSRAAAVISSGYTTPRRTVITASRVSAGRKSRNNMGLPSGPAGCRQDHVDQLDARERHDDAAQSIDQQIAAQERGCAEGPVFDAVYCEG